MINDGLWDVYNDFHMGITAEKVASKYGITRAEQDADAVDSHRKAAAAIDAGAFKDEIVGVDIPSAKALPSPSSTTNPCGATRPSKVLRR
jgi:acetyl-CoA C-acetyltransferase